VPKPHNTTILQKTLLTLPFDVLETGRFYRGSADVNGFRVRAVFEA
jgi:hypothetical protein